MLFLQKNNNFLIIILPVIEHPVKNKKMQSFQGTSENKDGHTLLLDISSFIDV